MVTVYKNFTFSLLRAYAVPPRDVYTSYQAMGPIMNTVNEHSANHRRSRKVPIVVVDDSPTILYAICALLEPEVSVEVVGRATNGQEAIEAVASLNPELVLMDISMPRMNGFRATEFLARQFPAIKVLLMSSEDSPYLRDVCRACGAFAFIYKPRFRRELLAVLKKHETLTAKQRSSTVPVFSPAAVAVAR
jgi:CheY-like chemotaxis protein